MRSHMNPTVNALKGDISSIHQRTINPDNVLDSTKTVCQGLAIKYCRGVIKTPVPFFTIDNASEKWARSPSHRRMNDNAFPSVHRSAKVFTR